MKIDMDTLEGISNYENLELPAVIDGEPLAHLEHVYRLPSVSITVPPTVTKITRTLFNPRNVFQECPNLQELKVYDSLTAFGYVAFADMVKHDNREIYADKGVVGSPSSAVCNIAFSDCPEFRKLIIRHADSSKGMIAPILFKGLEQLEEVRIEEGVKIIGDEAFSHCPNLKKIVIPASVTGIRYLAFQYDMNLKIYGYAGTFAEQYAQMFGYPFHAMRKEN